MADQIRDNGNEANHEPQSVDEPMAKQSVALVETLLVNAFELRPMLAAPNDRWPKRALAGEFDSADCAPRHGANSRSRLLPLLASALPYFAPATGAVAWASRNALTFSTNFGDDSAVA